MAIINKKIIKAKNRVEFDLFVKDHENRGWKKLSDVKTFVGDIPFQVLMGFEVNR